MKIIKSIMFLFLLLVFCDARGENSIDNYVKLFKNFPTYISDGFDFPVGKPDGKRYYNAQKFGVNNHLGEDWNGIRGGNSDLGDPIYSIANGYVSLVKNYGGGWGRVVRIVHKTEGKKYTYVESLYAHLKSFNVKAGEFVKRGQKIGTMGNVNGLYYAHLHFEIRSLVGMPLGGGYSLNTRGYLNPTDFIKRNRPAIIGR